MDENDVIVTVFTDSMEMYGSRLEEMTAKMGAYTQVQAAVDHNRYVLGMGIDGMAELSYYDMGMTTFAWRASAMRRMSVVSILSWMPTGLQPKAPKHTSTPPYSRLMSLPCLAK